MKSILTTVLLLLSIFSFAQDTEYVGELTISDITSGNPPNYYYTRSVTITPGLTGVTISATNGDFFITPIATNPPPSPLQNYVRVEVPRVEVTSEKDMTNLDGKDKAVSYTYSDGAGRTTMSSVAEAGPLFEDVVQHYEYDPTTGRQLQSFLPYAKAYTKPGEFIANSDTETEDFYDGTFNVPNIPVDSKYFSETEYDPRGRVEATIGVGETWNSNDNNNDKKTTYAYKVHNPATDGRILHWKIVSGVPQNDDDYSANELVVTVITDVEGKESRVVKDMQGLTITSQMKVGSTWHGSYNVYDDFGRVRFVIPPILANSMDSSFPNSLTTTQINELLFQYEYDSRGRVIREKAPGAGWVEFVYDQWDRLVMSRDAGQQTRGRWSFVKYDALNRPVFSGEVATAKTRSTLQNEANASNARWEVVNNSDSIGYSVYQTFPNLNLAAYDDYNVLNISQYDNYAFLNNSNWDAESNSYSYQNPTGFTGTHTTAVTNQSTGSKVKILGTSLFLNTVVYYDDELRVIQTIAENHLGGVDRLSNELDWKGELSKMLVEHDGSSQVDILSEYEYNHNGQLLKTWQTIDEPTNVPAINGDRVLVAEYKYNALGQVIEKNLHSLNGTSFLQSVDYDYNIRGWTSAINGTDLNAEGDADLFGMKFNYTNTESVNGTTVQGRYDGVVSSMEWNATNNVDATFGKTITGFIYNGKNQLSSTKYATDNSGWTGEANEYDMSASYDDNGNIETLTRKSEGTTIDNLTYTYAANSNKLNAVADASNNEEGVDDYYPGTDYAYDSNGNMTSDQNKEITDIHYNHMQLVDMIRFYDNTEVRSSYDAAGNRLTKAVYDADNNEIARIDYVGLVEYLNDEVNQVFTEQGRAYKQNDAYHYEYFLTDHQGNNRVAFGNLPERNIYTASMETEHSTIEESEFTFPSGIRSTTQNHTPLGNESVALNGTVANKQVGPAKVLNIANGDEVELEVWAKYTFGSWNNTSIADVASLVSTAFGGASTGTGAESASGNLSNAVSNPGANGLFNGNTTGEPEAYLQYLFFDSNYAYVAGNSGFVPVGGDSDGKFDKLASGNLKFNEAGYLFVYVVNESNQNADVFFDDLSITHSSGTESFKVSQVNEFYPYGLATSKSWRAEGYVDPGLLYQSAFAHYDSLTGYYDFLSRSYDPELGRFFAVDPAGQFASPYTGMGNMPHTGVDPNGENFFGFIAGALLATAGQAGAQSLNGNGSFWDNVKNNGFVIGGGYSQNQSYVGAGTASLGMVSTYNFPNQGSPIFGGFTQPGLPLDYSLPGPYQDGGLIANYGPDPSGGSNYDFLSALNQRNTFYPTVRPELDGEGGLGGRGYVGFVCSICDPNEYVQGPKSNGRWEHNARADLFLKGVAGVVSSFKLGTSISSYQLSNGEKFVRLGQKGTYLASRTFGRALGGIGVVLSGVSLAYEYKTGGTNTHSFVNGAVAAGTFAVTTTAAIVGAPAVIVGAAVFGLGYGIWSATVGDAWINNYSNNWGRKFIYPDR